MLHKDRISSIFVGPGELSVKDNSLIFNDNSGSSVLLPAFQFSTICLQPGTTVSHAAVKLCSETSVLLNWVGENGIRLYSSGSFTSAKTDRLWCQMENALNKNKRMSVAKRMYSYRFSMDTVGYQSIEQMSGMEGVRVRTIYKKLAEEYGIEWTGRKFIINDFDSSDSVNKCISIANSCLYGICHCAIISAGYSPSIAFIHGHNALAFVFDIADLFKFNAITRIAFRISTSNTINIDRDVRIACRDFFKTSNFMENIIPIMDRMIGYDETFDLKPSILQPRDFQSYADNIHKESNRI